MVRVGARSALGGMAAVTAGSMVANIASYALAWRASTWLGPLGYGEFASLSAAQLLVAVPALALQTVVARERVHGHTAATLRRLTVRVAAVVAVLALVAAPILSAVLDTSVLATIAALAAAPTLVLLAGEQGLLQGDLRFGRLAVVLAGAGAAKVAPPVLVSLTVAGTSAAAVPVALLASAVGTAAMAAAVRVDAGSAAVRVDAGSAAVRIDAGSAAVRMNADGRPGRGPNTRAVLAASQVQLVIVALASMDLVLARAVLTASDAGLYAVGAVVAKAAFWLPQSVGVVLYPSMADPLRSARAVRAAVAVLAAVGATVVVGTAVAAPLARYVVRPDFLPVQPLLWLFAVQGSAVAVVSVILLSTVATRRTRASAVAWVALGIQTVVIVVVARTVQTTIVIAAATAVLTAAVTYLTYLRRSKAGNCSVGASGSP